MAHKNALNWFEIYSSDFKRAKKFYETILATPLQEAQSATCQMAMFPFDMQSGVGGSVTQMNGIAPGAGGTIVYLNVEGDLDGVLNRIPTAGGTVIKPRMSIGEHGYIGLFKDTEGNIVGLHSQS